MSDEIEDSGAEQPVKAEKDDSYYRDRGDFILAKDLPDDDEEDLDITVDEEESDEAEDAELPDTETEDDGTEEPETDEEADEADEDANELAESKERIKRLEALLEKLIDKDPQAKQKEEEAKPPEYDFQKAEEAYVDLILEGDKAKAAALRKEIDANRNALIQYELDKLRKDSESLSDKKYEKAIREMKFSEAVSSIEKQYPVLDKKSKQYDADIVDAVNGLMNNYISAGKDDVDALNIAVSKIMRFASGKEAKAEKKGPGEERKKAARAKALDAQKKQPAKPAQSMKGKPGNLAGLDVTKLTDRQFKNLTRGERAMLRGDVLKS